jgi:hypothetical protein
MRYATVHRCCLTNRWSSRLECRSEPRVRRGKELRPMAVVGGAAQLYVMWFNVSDPEE